MRFCFVEISAAPCEREGFEEDAGTREGRAAEVIASCGTESGVKTIELSSYLRRMYKYSGRHGWDGCAVLCWMGGFRGGRIAVFLSP